MERGEREKNISRSGRTTLNSSSYRETKREKPIMPSKHIVALPYYNSTLEKYIASSSLRTFCSSETNMATHGALFLIH